MDKGRIVKIQYTTFPPDRVDASGIFRPESRDFTWQIGGRVGELVVDEITWDRIDGNFWVYIKVRGQKPDANGHYEKKVWLSLMNPTNFRAFHDYKPLTDEKEY